MPLLIPKVRSVRRQSNLTGQPTSPPGTAITSHTVAHQFPSTYTVLIATTSFDTYWVNVRFCNNVGSNTDTDSLVSIYVGGAGSEQPLIPYLLAGWVGNVTSDKSGGRMYGFPLRIPAGSRITARHQSVRTSTDVSCLIELLGGESAPFWTGTAVEAVGYDTATSSGVYVTPGTTSEGTLTSIGTNTYEWGFVRPMLGGNTDTTSGDGQRNVDIASGSATSALISGLDDFWFAQSSGEFSTNWSAGRFCTIPAATTLYLRDQTSSPTEASAYCIYGVY